LKTGQVGFPTGKFVSPGLPGSLMKLVATAAMREESLFPVTQTLECPGHVIIHRKTFTCQVAHGRLTLTQALGHSCNVFFVQAAQALSPEVFLRYARGFGLADSVAGLAPGLFPDTAGQEPEYYVLGLAKDLQPQALQILRAVALIATRGTVLYLHSAEEPDSSKEPFQLTLSDATWALLEQGMRLACREGTARNLDQDDRLH
jgi:cell division protein FtsI/penicillin-binding protein 2